MTQTAKELRGAAARIYTNAKSKFDEITPSMDEARAKEIEAEVDKMMSDAAELEQRADRADRIEAAMSRMQGDDPRRPTGADTEGRGEDRQPGVDYRSAFHQYLSAEGNIALMSPEARARLVAGYAKISEAEARAMVTTSGAAGGYSIPDEMMGDLVRAMAEWGPMYDDNLCRVIKTNTGASWPIPTIDDTANEAGAHTEGAALTDDGGADPVLGQKTMSAFAFDTEWIRVSKELADDSMFATEQLLTDLLGERMGRTANKQLTTANGTNAPQGIVNGSSLGATGASATAFTFDEILNFLHSVDPAYRASPKAKMMFNDTSLLALRKLKDGDGNYLLKEASDGAGRLVAGSVNIGYVINQAMASAAAGTKPLVFGDFGRYYVRKVGNPLIGALTGKEFWPGFGVAGYIRFDGKVVDSRAIKHFAMAGS